MSFACTANSTEKSIRSTHVSAKQCEISKRAVPQLSADMWTSANKGAGTNASHTTLVATGTAPSARACRAHAGLQRYIPRSSLHPTSIWFSPCPENSTQSSSKTVQSSTTCSSGPLLNPCSNSQRTGSICGQRWDSQRFSIPGIRKCSSTPIST